MSNAKEIDVAVDQAQKDLFGGTLASQGRGFYVTLELLAICRGAMRRQARLGVQAPLPLLPAAEDNGKVIHDKTSHDIARRLLREALGDAAHPVPNDRKARLTAGAESPQTLSWIADLFAGLTVPIPFARRSPDWGGLHLYPYVGELIHDDAVFRKTSPTEYVSLERYLYRGGGALAYQLLRADGDAVRLAALRSGFARLVGNSGTSLGRLATVLGKYDVVGSAGAGEGRQGVDFVDDTLVEHVPERETRWSTLLRDGCQRILSSAVPSAKQVEHLMYWVPYAMARHQLDLAASYVGRLESSHETTSRFIDAVGDTQIRARSRSEFSSHRQWLSDAVIARAKAILSTDLSPSSERQLQAAGSEISNFFSSTMAVVGALNANTGQRHHTIASPLLEALVFASLDQGEQMPFDVFCQTVLGERLGLVIDERTAARQRNAALVDNARMTANAGALGERLIGLGLMTNLSDATRMVEAHS